MALDDYSIFYIENKPKIIRARGGEKIKNPPAGRRRTTTHGIVINLFNITNEMHYLLSQEIGNENPLDWLEQKRVEMNYQSAKFSDPDVPQHFSILNKRSVRQLTASYMDSGGLNYEFDPDHAMLAFPIKAAQMVKQNLELLKCYDLSNEQIDTIKRCFRDGKGALPRLQAIF